MWISIILSTWLVIYLTFSSTRNYPVWCHHVWYSMRVNDPELKAFVRQKSSQWFHQDFDMYSVYDDYIHRRLNHIRRIRKYRCLNCGWSMHNQLIRNQTTESEKLTLKKENLKCFIFVVPNVNLRFERIFQVKYKTPIN